MGAVTSRLAGLGGGGGENQYNLDHGSSANDLGNPLARGTKRRREVEEDISSCNQELERLLNTPKKKKLFTTSQYIYENLFQVGSFKITSFCSFKLSISVGW